MKGRGKTGADGRREYAREGLGKARRGLAKLSNESAPLAYLDPGLTAEGPPRTDNRIEGGVDARLGGGPQVPRGG